MSIDLYIWLNENQSDVKRIKYAVWLRNLLQGDPTIFGNLKPPTQAVEAIKESVASQLYNGYAPSTGEL